jgi:hypothetical protein
MRGHATVRRVVLARYRKRVFPFHSFTTSITQERYRTAPLVIPLTLHTTSLTSCLRDLYDDDRSVKDECPQAFECGQWQAACWR